VREARSTLGMAVGLALLISIMLSLFMARTIVTPLRTLARAAIRVRLGRGREVEVPRLPERHDEIGLLARAVADMTGALRHRIDAVESFAADVAHEIKNPLASLRSAIDSLARVEDPELRRRLTQVAAHDVRRIDRLVSEISEASRIDAELSRATFEPVDLARLLANVIDRREARGENGTCRIELAHTPGSTMVMGVPLRLERVIENLLDNAVSFSPENGTIAVRLAREDDSVAISVCDQGPGIPEEAREKVFTRFHSLRPEAEDFGTHSGLGLAIGRTIAEAHDGTLVVRDPEHGPGACLVLTLPAA
jgi:two-component system sensor histidine kinase ChvG